MSTFADLIIEKMNGEVYPDLNMHFIYNLTNESKRGAVLIGTAKVEEYLENQIVYILPQTSNRYKKRLLNYPGTISSLSSKIDLLYAFRIIDSKFYDSLNVLRGLRNKAAHTSDSFELEDIKIVVDNINDFEEHFVGLIEHIATDNLIKIKQKQMRDAVEDAEGGDELKERVLKEKFKNLENEPAFKDQLIIWKLSYGLTFMCIKLLVLIDEYKCLEEKNHTWLDILNKD